MSNTERYRAQHAEIMRLATDLKRHLSPAALAADPGPARHILSELSGKLLMHLAAEDNVLYPQMLKSTDAKARALAQRFVAEMQPITDAFKQYAVRWANAKSIQAGAESFVRETNRIMTVLNERIRREHTELYSLADSLTH
ncbi:MAG TPA: hemerythrin domain-containing protein [Steroidobacteraceae bacterium]|nr:hemerythrin domain-containing protein [Steroidobacteraceae bacterium]